MLGAFIVVGVIVLVLPPLMMMGGAVISAVLGWSLWDNAEQEHEGSELIPTNY